MTMFRAYEVSSGLVPIGGTSATPMLYVAVPSTSDGNVAKIKVGIDAAASPAPPSNGSVLFQLAKVTGTVGGGAALTPTPLGPQGVVALTTWKSGSTALTGLAQGAELWRHPLPFSSGAAWADDHENTGLEVYLAPSGLYAVYFTAAAGAGSNMVAEATVWFTE